MSGVPMTEMITWVTDAGDESPVERCDKTVDIFSGKAAIEEGAAA